VSTSEEHTAPLAVQELRQGEVSEHAHQRAESGRRRLGALAGVSFGGERVVHEGTEVLEFLCGAHEAKAFPVRAEHRERRRVAVFLEWLLPLLLQVLVAGAP